MKGKVVVEGEAYSAFWIRAVPTPPKTFMEAYASLVFTLGNVYPPDDVIRKLARNMLSRRVGLLCVLENDVEAYVVGIKRDELVFYKIYEETEGWRWKLLRLEEIPRTVLKATIEVIKTICSVEKRL